MSSVRAARRAVALTAFLLAPTACLLTTDLDGLTGGTASDAASAVDAPADRAVDGRADAPSPSGDAARDVVVVDAFDGGADATCSPDLSTDPNNCGTCGRICDKGPCALGACNSCATANENTAAKIECSSGLVVRKVVFASYGQPAGSCGAFTKSSTCNADTSVSVVEATCLGKPSCLVTASNEVFGDPCVGEFKALYVQVACGP